MSNLQFCLIIAQVWLVGFMLSDRPDVEIVCFGFAVAWLVLGIV